MNRECNSWQEYDQAFKDLNKEPILGTHTIGALTINVNHLRWSVSVGTNFHLTGTAGKGPAMRAGIDKACRKWLADSRHMPPRK